MGGLMIALAAVAMVATDAFAQADASLSAVTAARSRYTSASRRVSAQRATMNALARQITSYKKDGGQPQALDRLLKRSVRAESTLRTALAAHRKAESEYAAVLESGVAAVDNEMRRLVPQLKTGPIRDRRRAARQINALRASRKSLRAEMANLAKARRRQKAWAQYQVRFDLRDGPSELTEKADFVEDTRDKVVRKRRALLALLAEAQRDREIAQSAQDFRTDVTLFDEETRQGRVLRNRGSDSASEGGAPVPVSQGGQEDRGGDDFSGPPTPTQAPPVTPLRAINPDVLLNLRVEDLAAGALDVSTLERYVDDLRALERYLSGQADSLRERADALEADEARKLQR